MTGRNAICPCGSGQKYKHCCGAVAGVPASPVPDPSPADLAHHAALSHAARGAALQAEGRLAEAVAAYQKAVQIEPRWLEVQNNLGNALLGLGRHEDAILCYRAAQDSGAPDAEVFSNLGNALRHVGRLDEATACCRQALALNPELLAAHNHLGLALAAAGRVAEAAASYRHALALRGDDVETLNNLGNALRDLGDLQEALICFRRALALEPRLAASHRNVGNVLLDLGLLEPAARSYRQALALAPGDAASLLTLSVALRHQGLPTDALAACRAAVAARPEAAESLAFLGELQADRGEFAAALESFRQAIALDPSYPSAWVSIATHRKMTSADGAWREAVEGLLARQPPLRHVISLRYALGKYFDDCERYALAFEQYRLANESTKRLGLVYDRPRLTARVDALQGGFDARYLQWTRSAGNASTCPVMIVGMPRSGTTLVEQILASHGEVFGAGELDFWDRALTTYAAAGLEGHAGAKLFPRMAADYLQRLAALSGGAARVVDKMPANFLNVGLIHAVFPKARIIHLQRHPIDTCLSIYFQHFPNSHPHANDLDDLAHYYREYRRITNHWRRVLPADIWLDVPYEALVAEPEVWSRRLVEFIGLPWDPACLDFHRTARVVITTSKWQVRQKIHRASAGRWKNYEAFVGPLRDLALPD